MTTPDDLDAQDEFPAAAYIQAHAALMRHIDGSEVLDSPALQLTMEAKQHAETYFGRVGADRALRAMARQGRT